ncbi:MAG: hypothetical protein WDN06_06160 [Asticcacaulis sp.]
MPQDTGAKIVESFKRDAARLLKAQRAGDAAAQARFAALDHPPAEPQLKHALAVIARDEGFAGWAELKAAKQGVDFSEFFARPGLGDTLNAWFSTYDEAKAHQRAAGGVVLPYRHQVFVSSSAILGRLGFEPDHPDWQAIGHDFVRPGSPDAFARIKAALTRRFAQKPE